ncbi:Uncharacterised protein [Amycolatopsis camponoti]|uniref:Resolvase/invertase-type recombinase catalytic domain-containing protein n=1 Tax=Amycolatopsis camponoti TaxID=2606593 RepID=A0A6I8LSD2_9PSEU|nr:Uncharacterised protein [Amycolatopsis camponoti]
MIRYLDSAELTRHWNVLTATQREVAEETIRGRGMIVAEYFDEGCSRRLSWRERPAAAQLMAAAAGPNRSFDVVVIGEYKGAFYGDQFDAVLTALQAQGIELWLPEADGPVNLKDPVHQALMLLLGSQSRREVTPDEARVDRPDRLGHPRKSEVHGPAGVEPARRQNTRARPPRCSSPTVGGTRLGRVGEGGASGARGRDDVPGDPGHARGPAHTAR